MTADDTLLVPAVETPVRGTAIRAYEAARIGAGQTWGEPDLDVAAAHLRALADDATLRARLGELAALAAERQREASLRSGALSRLYALAERRARGEAVPPATAAARARVAREAPGRRLRRRIVNALRAAGVGPRA